MVAIYVVGGGPLEGRDADGADV